MNGHQYMVNILGHSNFVHLSTFEDDRRTLCGRSTLEGDWAYGDETVSGHMADCETCYRKMHETRTDPDQVQDDNLNNKQGSNP